MQLRFSITGPISAQLTNNILLSVCRLGSSRLTNNFGLNSGNLFVLFVFMSSRLPTLLLLGQSTHLFMALSSVLFLHLSVYVYSQSKAFNAIILILSKVNLEVVTSFAFLSVGPAAKHVHCYCYSLCFRFVFYQYQYLFHFNFQIRKSSFCE